MPTDPAVGLPGWGRGLRSFGDLRRLFGQLDLEHEHLLVGFGVERNPGIVITRGVPGGETSLVVLVEQVAVGLVGPCLGRRRRSFDRLLHLTGAARIIQAYQPGLAVLVVPYAIPRPGKAGAGHAYERQGDADHA